MGDADDGATAAGGGGAGSDATGDSPDHVDLVARRLDVLETLTGEPTAKRDLIAAVSDSRSTVDRAVRALADAGLVERVADGYRTTLAGRIAVDRYRRHLADQRAVARARDALAALPPDADPPTPLVTTATVHDDGDPVRRFQVLADRLAGADSYRLALPALGDSRHLRLCRARARRDGLDAEPLLDPAVVDRIRAEFPGLATGLADATTVSPRRVETPPFGLALATTGDRTWAALLVYDAGDLHAVLASESEAAVTAVADRLDALAATAASVETTRAALRPDDPREPLLDTPDTAGLRRVDRSHFARRTPNDPASAWRVGFDLADVYYGYALDRLVAADADPEGWAEAGALPGDGDGDGDGRGHTPVAADAVLVDRLRSGADQVVLGPPGTGKSTLCRAVACRWVEREAGVVLHRSGDDPGLGPLELGPAIDAVVADDGHTLVVVEDAATPATLERALELRRRCRDRDTRVAVLLEARESDWAEARTALPARLRETCRTDLGTVRPPAVDRRTCERAIAAFEAATGRSVSLSPAELLSAVETDTGAGAMYLLGHRLATHTDPDPWGDRPPSGLEDDVRDALDALDDATEGSITLSVGVLAAVLTAAERPVTDGLLHALAEHATDATDGPDPETHRRVAAARSALLGRLLFEPGESGSYRTHHPEWALQFLEHALARHERRTVAAFERGLAAVGALAADPARRERVREWLGRETPVVDRLGTDGAVDDLLTDVFDLAVRRPALAPLLGTADGDRSLPAAAAANTRLERLGALAVARYGLGEYDAAVDAAEELLDRAEAAPVTAVERTRALVRGHHQIAKVEGDRGAHDRAREHLAAGLAAVEHHRERTADGETDAEDGAAERAVDGTLVRDEVKLRNTLAWLAMEAGEFETAENQLATAREVGATLGPTPARSATLYYLGHLADRRGDPATAEEFLQESLAIDRECPSMQPTDEAATLNGLGRVATARGETERAAEYFRRSLAIETESGTERGRMASLLGLGRSLVAAGEYDAAVEALDEARSVADDLGIAVGRARALRDLGRVARERGAYETAADRLDRARQVALTAEEERAVAFADRELGHLARARGEARRARDRYERSQRRLRADGADRPALDVLSELVDLAADQGDHAAATDYCETAVEVATELGLDQRRETLAERRRELAGAADADD